MDIVLNGFSGLCPRMTGGMDSRVKSENDRGNGYSGLCPRMTGGMDTRVKSENDTEEWILGSVPENDRGNGYSGQGRE